MADGLKERYDEHMAGRNGADALSRTCLVVALVLVLLSFATVGVSPFLYMLVLLLGVAAAVYAALRMNSKDVARRRRENDAFVSFFSRGSGRGAEARGRTSRAASERPRAPHGARSGQGRGGDGRIPEEPAEAGQRGQAPEKVTIACENCGQRLSVPVGAGNIRITCPKCRNKFTMLT